MAAKKEEQKEEIRLGSKEQEEYEQGRSLYEMDKHNPGWQIVKDMLERVAYHSWVDPRGTAIKDEWVWQELNAFHASNNAKELLEQIAQLISRYEYLDKVKSGEIERKKMRI